MDYPYRDQESMPRAGFPVTSLSGIGWPFLLKVGQEILMGLMDQPHDDNETNKPAKMAYSSHLCQTCECFNQPEQVERRPHEHFPELLLQSD